MTKKSPKAVKALAKSAARKKVIRRNVPPWIRPKVVLPYESTTFTEEQIREAVKAVVAS